MQSGQCTICLQPGAEYIADKVVKKELTNEQAARELDVSLATWLIHYENHIRKKLLNNIVHDIEPIKNNLLDKIKKAKESMERLISLTEKISKNLENEGNQENTKLIMAYATLEKNVISGLKETAILEGDINTASTINIQNNTIKIEQIMAIVTEDAPPAFKEIILQRLKKLEV